MGVVGSGCGHEIPPLGYLLVAPSFTPLYVRVFAYFQRAPWETAGFDSPLWMENYKPAAAAAVVVNVVVVVVVVVSVVVSGSVYSCRCIIV